jgi:SAM-dependent methyltransferase
MLAPYRVGDQLMGIASSQGLPHLLFLAKKYREQMSGSILQLGRQDAYFDFSVLQSQARHFGVELKNVPVRTVENPWTKRSVIDDETLLSALGFNKVESLDFVADEKPSIVHDLNQDVPPSFHARWHVVYDGGTLEHVFDVATAFRNIHTMLKPGGLVIHESPTNNFVDHGFWQLNPTALFDFYSANGYEILEAWISLFPSADTMHYETPRRFIYDPAAFEALSVGRFPNGLAGVFIAARKPLVEKPAVKPTQGFYKRHWKIGGQSGCRAPVSAPGGILDLKLIAAA